MTKLSDPTSMELMNDPRQHRVGDAEEAAAGAARAAGVTLRELTDLADLEEVYRLYDRIWRPDPANPPVTTEMLRALGKAGNYVCGAYDGDELVGACVGFFGPPADEALHSHIAGVGAAALGRGVGYALKLHQRAWALARGAQTIAWTFDPLVRRNAYVNLAKLAASPAEYLTNFYGGMRDGINGDDPTDRLLVHWPLTAPEVVAACAGTLRHVDAAALRAAGAAVALDRGPGQAPVRGALDGATILVAVPGDVEALRGEDAALAKEWRVALREILGPLLGGGARVGGFDRAGWYVLTREGEQA